MSRKLLPNRISKSVAPDARAKVRQAFQLLDEALGEVIAIEEDEYKGLRKIADKLKRVTDDVFEIVKENTEFLEAPLTVEEITRDKEFYEFCDFVRTVKNAFDLRLDREQNVAGAEYNNACGVYEGDVTDKVNRDKKNAKALSVQAQLNGIDRNRTRPTAPKAETKPNK